MNIASVGGQGVRPADVTAFRGDSVMLNCRGTQVSWFLAPRTKIFTSPDVWNTPQGNKYEMYDNYNLRVKNLDPETDGGIYQCETDEYIAGLLSANLVVLGNIFSTYISLQPVLFSVLQKYYNMSILYSFVYSLSLVSWIVFALVIIKRM